MESLPAEAPGPLQAPCPGVLAPGSLSLPTVKEKEAERGERQGPTGGGTPPAPGPSGPQGEAGVGNRAHEPCWGSQQRSLGRTGTRQEGRGIGQGGWAGGSRHGAARPAHGTPGLSPRESCGLIWSPGLKAHGTQRSFAPGKAGATVPPGGHLCTRHPPPSLVGKGYFPARSPPALHPTRAEGDFLLN